MSARPPLEAKVLIVEDDVFFQRVLQKRLEAEGYKVLLAGDGREGMKAIVTWEPDVVLSDWMMPEVDGLELCQSVKTGLKDAAPYFILLTAKGELSDRLLGLQTGADDYVVKPCDHSEILARVRAGVRIVKLTQQLRTAVTELQMANAELTSTRESVEDLGEQMPICSYCRRVQESDGSWQDMEQVLSRRLGVDTSHEVCPDCAASVTPLLPPSKTVVR
jgi:sigma-B regulation protein RsbU (phosphoserine phosphatase)